MSLRALSWAWDQDVPSTDKFVLAALADFANADHDVWPSQATLARRTNHSRETVNRALRRLEERGLIVAMKRGGNVRDGLRYRLAVGDHGDVAMIELTLFAFEVGGSVRLGVSYDADALLAQMRDSNRERVSLFLARTAPAALAKAALAALSERFDNAREECGWFRIARADLLAAANDVLPEKAALPPASTAPPGDGSCDGGSHDHVTDDHMTRLVSCDGGSHGHVTEDHMDISLEPSLNRESPQNPPLPIGEDEALDQDCGVADGRGGAIAQEAHPSPPPERFAAQFDALALAFKLSARMDREAARHEFGLLTLAERDDAIRAAPHYRAACERDRHRGVDLDRWLRGKRWRDIDAAKAAKLLPTRVFVYRDSEASRAWAAWLRAQSGSPFNNIPVGAAFRGIPVTSREGRDGWFFPTLWPPRAQGPPAAA